MTLAFSLNDSETIWMMTDRRLTRGRQLWRDDARKLMTLEATDGTAILGYAGLGETRSGTEPADWMSAVLRTRNLPLEVSLNVLADAARRELPPHLQGLSHSIMVTAFVNEEVRLYTIDLASEADGRLAFRYTRHLNNYRAEAGARERVHQLAWGGSGAHVLMRDTAWQRPLRRLIRACNRKKVTPYAVADYLAGINFKAHQSESTVGPGCLVIWRHRKGGLYGGGGAHQFYEGTMRAPGAPNSSIPMLMNGMDVTAIMKLMAPHVQAVHEAMMAGKPPPEFDKDQINAEAAKLPDAPDERLR